VAAEVVTEIVRCDGDFALHGFGSCGVLRVRLVGFDLRFGCHFEVFSK
jgi:hypothetical protein